MGIWLDSFRTKAFTTADGAYRGQAILHIPHGHGTLTRSEADVYEGTFSWGKPHGEGIWHIAGVVINGKWDRGHSPSTGQLEYFTADGTLVSYEGELAGARGNGRGKLKGTFGYLEGTIEGSFKAGASDGNCVLRLSDGSRIDGMWKDGLLQSGCTYTYSNGDVFFGALDQDMKPHGSGKLQGADGTLLEGYWNHGFYEKPFSYSNSSTSSSYSPAPKPTSDSGGDIAVDLLKGVAVFGGLLLLDAFDRGMSSGSRSGSASPSPPSNSYRGGCTTCWGSGQITTPGDLGGSKLLVPCPTCGGTGAGSNGPWRLP